MIDLIDVATGHVRVSLPTSAGGLVHGGLAFTPDGQNLRVIVYHQNALVVLDCDVASERVTSSGTLSCSTAQNTTHVSSDGQLLAFAPSLTAPVARLSTDVVLWDVEQDREMARLSGSAEVTGVAFSPDGKSLAIGREGGSVEVWDLRLRRLRRVFHPHTADFNSRLIQFAPDGTTLASLGDWSREGITMHTVRRRIAVLRLDVTWQPPLELVLLDTATGRRLLRTEDECTLSFSPDNRTLATSHRDGAIRLRDRLGR
jgi:WD40 repeat protein